MFKKLLPIGSIVLLKGGVKKLMVIGLKPVKQEEPDVVYDYIGVMYPEGFMGAETMFLFNHDVNSSIIILPVSYSGVITRFNLLPFC